MRQKTKQVNNLLFQFPSAHFCLLPTFLQLLLIIIIIIIQNVETNEKENEL